MDGHRFETDLRAASAQSVTLLAAMGSGRFFGNCAFGVRQSIGGKHQTARDAVRSSVLTQSQNAPSLGREGVRQLLKSDSFTSNCGE
jgi:hypothetical protein